MEDEKSGRVKRKISSITGEIGKDGEHNETVPEPSVDAESFVKGSQTEGVSQNKDGATSGNTGATVANNKKRRTQKGEDDISISEMLFEIHLFLSILTKTEELSITKIQSDSIESAINKLDKNIKAKISPKFMAWLNLFTVLVGVYVPKGISISRKIKGKGKIEHNNLSVVK